MIILTAPPELRETGSYEACLRMLHWRYEAELVFKDGDLPEDSASYDPSNVITLYVLSREDGTIDLGVYRKWEHLCEKLGAQATLLFPVGESAAELGNFTVSLLRGFEGSDQYYAMVTPESVTSNSGGPMPEAWSRVR
ncbi:hypothetical protein [Rubrobacter aplysinae]|uniref:hypothetical protein n=1 Tax=Rubrobacter aplysinae TaxID=909625 RepID=UPI00064BC2C2|nr:hypothetical protein [Rubrobacter aplysinae]